MDVKRVNFCRACLEAIAFGWRHTFLCALLVFFYLASAVPLHAEEKQEQPVEDQAEQVVTTEQVITTDKLAKGEEILSFKLKEFMPEPGPTITLRTSNSQHDLYIPLAERIEITAAKLRLRFINSISLLRERSQLRVLLNGSTITQLPLRPEKSIIDVEIALPVEQLNPGFNRLTFAVIQHYTLECEDPAAPELWTEIDAEKSAVVLRGRLRHVNPTLADLEHLISPALGNPRRYRMLIPEISRTDHLPVAAIIAQGIGARQNYRIPAFRQGIARLATKPSDPPRHSGPLPGLEQKGLGGADNVLIGTLDELQPYLSEELIGSITGAFIAIYPLASDPDYFVLLVSGTTEDELKEAAKAVGLLSFPFTDSPTTLVKNLHVPPASSFGRKHFIETGREYTFKELGFEDSTARGASFHAFDITFSLPPDFYANETANINFLLDFAYGSDMREDTVFNVYLNNIFERAIPLKSNFGAVIKQYDVPIPMRSFKPGRNVVRFEPALVPLVGGECIAVDERNLRFTLFDSSVVQFPVTTRYVQQPNLQLFSKTMFPYRGKEFDGPLTIALLSKDRATLAATWTLLAKIAQVQDAALLDIDVTTSLPEDDRQLIVISTIDDVDQRLLAKAPINLMQLDTLSSFPYPTDSRLVKETQPKSRLDRVLEMLKLNKEEAQEEELVPPPTVRMEQNVVPQEHGLMVAFESPFAEKRTVTLLTAATPGRLLGYTERLVTPKLWGQLAGDIVLWDASHEEVKTQQAGKFFYVGDASMRERLQVHVSMSPWYWVIAVLALIFILAWLTYLLLNRRFLRRHGRDVRVEV